MTTSPDKLALASRVGQAGGPDRELGADIIAAVIGMRGDPALLPNDLNVTASLDAITALIAEKLSGASWQCGFVSEHHSDFETPQGGWGRVFVRDEDAEVVQAKTPALALCAAFLKASASTEDQP